MAERSDRAPEQPAGQAPLQVAWLSRSPSLEAVVNATVQRRLDGLDGVLVELASGDSGGLTRLHSRLSEAYEGSQFSYGEGFMAYLAQSWGGR